MTAWHGGKGSSQRKRTISDEEWENRWDAIFRRDNAVRRDEQEQEPKGKPIKEEPLKETDND